MAGKAGKKAPPATGYAAQLDKKTIEKMIARRHPDYEVHAPEWDFIDKAIAGGPGYVEGNLYQHPKEDDRVFAARKKRAADNHFNLTAQVLNTWLGYLFQKLPTQDPKLHEVLQAFIKSGTQDRQGLIELAKEIAKCGLGKGKAWIAVDKPAAIVDDQGAPRTLTLQQEREAGLSPYAYLVAPQDVLDGKIERGEVVWLFVREHVRDDADPITGSGEVTCRYRLWTRDAWVLITPKKTKGGAAAGYDVTEGTHQVGRVPFVAYTHGDGSGFACPGLLADIAHVDRAIWNKWSLLDEIHYSITFPQLAMPHDGPLYEDTSDGDDEEPSYELTPEGAEVLEVGLHSVLPYNSEKGAPAYVVPPSGPSQELARSIDQMTRLLFAMALLDGETSATEGDASKASPSGISKAYTFEKLNKALAKVAAKLEAVFRQVFELVLLWQGLAAEVDNLPEVPWDFPEQFEVQSLASFLADFFTFMGGNVPSAKAQVVAWQLAIRRMFPKLTPDELEEIDQEIEDQIESRQLGAAAMLQVGPDGKPLQLEAAMGDQVDAQDDQGDGKPGDKGKPMPMTDKTMPGAARGKANGAAK